MSGHVFYVIEAMIRPNVCFTRCVIGLHDRPIHVDCYYCLYHVVMMRGYGFEDIAMRFSHWTRWTCDL